MRTMTIVAVLFYFSISMAGCTKETGAPIYTVAFSRNALAFVLIPPGKYFIYKDSATGQTDSVVVNVNSKLETVYKNKATQGWAEPAHYFERVTLILSKNNSPGDGWFVGSADARSSVFFHSIDTASIVLSDFTKVSYPLMFLMNHSDIPIPTVIIEGRNYANVIITEFDNHYDTIDPYYLKTTCYWSKGIGLIKMTKTTTGGLKKTYTLLRYG